MKPILITLFSLLSLSATAAEFQRGDDLSLRGDFADMLFASGGNVDASLRSADDVFLAGGRVRIRESQAEGIWAAAGDLELDRTNSPTGTFAAGQVELRNSRLEELIVAGGSVRLEDTAVSDDLIAAGGEIMVGPGSNITGSAVIAGGSVRLGGRFDGDVRVFARDLTVEPTAVINGKLTHTSEALSIAPGAVLARPAEAVPITSDRGGSAIASVFVGLLFAIGALAIAPLLVLLFPRFADQGQKEIRQHPWELLGKGTLIALVVPFLWLALLASILGTPLALAAIPFLLLMGLFAWSLAIYSLGARLYSGLRKREISMPIQRRRQALWTAAAAILMAVIVWIPFLGQVAALVAFLIGLGGLYSLLRRQARVPATP